MLIRSLIVNVVFTCAASAATLSVQPSSLTAQAGHSLTLNVAINGVADLYAFQFDVTFDPALLATTNVMEGALFSASGVAFNPGIIDNTAGTITFITDSLSGPGPGISGTGLLASVLLKALAPGTAAVGLSNVILLDSALADIAVTPASSTVTITNTPEASTAGMLGIATLISILFTGSRRSVRARTRLLIHKRTPISTGSACGR